MASLRSKGPSQSRFLNLSQCDFWFCGSIAVAKFLNCLWPTADDGMALTELSMPMFKFVFKFMFVSSSDIHSMAGCAVLSAPP